MYDEFRLIRLRAPHDAMQAMKDIARECDILDWEMAHQHNGNCEISMLLGPTRRQEVLDRLQQALQSYDDWRILVQPLEAAIPKPEEPEDLQKERARSKRMQSREELYNDISGGLVIDANFLAMVVLSSIVAAVGLLEDNVAVIIGAMVIAPLLSSSLALIFSATIGERALILQALKVALLGAGLSILTGIVTALFLPVDLESQELLTRTDVGAASVALALASGAAAALSVSTGIASALVGVMVAVALLPPAMTMGLMIGAAHYDLASGAALLLAVNFVCVNLSGQLVFWLTGLKPRTWFQRKSARQSIFVSVTTWVVALLVLSVAIYLRRIT